MIKNQVENTFESMSSSYDDCDVVVWGVPFDGTVSNRPGTRFGPQAIITEFINLESYSPYQQKDLEDYKICDLGELAIPIGNTEKAMNAIEQNILDMLVDNKRIISLGGEHLISYPIIKSYIASYPKLHVIQLDAHADLRDDYLGEKLSHATVMRRVYENLNKGTLTQLGIRSGTKGEFEFSKANTHMNKFDLGDISSVIKSVGDDPVYLSIDLDILDPSIFPGTGTPEPGGITFKELMAGMIELSNLNIVGADIVELAPHYDQSGGSTVVACKVLRELLLMMV